MTDREELRDRLDAVEEGLADTPGTDPMFSYADADAEPDPDGSGALFHLPREVTDNWVRTDTDGRGDT